MASRQRLSRPTTSSRTAGTSRREEVARRFGNLLTDEPDFPDRVPLDDLEDVLRVHGAKHRVPEIQPQVVNEVDEDLRVPRVAATRGEAERRDGMRARRDLVAHE